MNVVKRPVLVAAGGTGGHVFPALAVADELRLKNVPVVWVGTRTGIEARIVPPTGIDIRWITVAGLRGKGLIGSLTGPLKLLLACLQSVLLVNRLKPCAVLGMGGFVSGPVGLAALLTRRPLVLHEQNAVVGMTNHYLSRFSTRLFSAMPDVFPAGSGARVVGNPVRRALVERASAGTAVRSEAEALQILVIGGSRGARSLNTVVPEAIRQFARPCRVLHQCGGVDMANVKAAYAEADPMQQIEVQAFIDDIPNAYAAADVVICRSGAMTVTELCAMGAASVLVPFPHAVDDHQTRNAEFLSRANAAVLLPEPELNAQSLAGLLQRFDAERNTLVDMGRCARLLFRPAAAEAVADALVEVAS